MKRLLFIIASVAVLAAAAVLAPVLLEDPGRVVIEMSRWRIEMSALVLAMLVVAAWIALAVALALIRLPGQAAGKARRARAGRQLESGLLALAEGDWQRAEKKLDRALAYRGSTAGYLAAARAAQGQADIEGRDRWLQLADSRLGRRHFVTGLARARMLLDEGRTAEAIPILENLHLKKSRHQGLLRMLLQAYQDAGRWRDLRFLTPALYKAEIVDARRRDELAVLAGVRDIEQSEHAAELEAAWRALPRRQRRERELVLAYGRRAAELGRSSLAGSHLKKCLDTELDTRLLRVYALVEAGDRPGRIRDCLRWLESEPNHPGLHLALGMMYLDDRDDDRARGHLEKAVAAHPDGEAYALLGRVLDRSGRLEAAAQCYRNALRLQSGRAPEQLPPPQRDALESDASEPDAP